MRSLEALKKHLRPGQVYRRADLAKWSRAVDRHLKKLLEKGVLQKMSQGVYYCPAKASFGEVPPEDEKLVAAFLKSKDFLLTSPNLYNALGVGTTQLYNTCVVYNHKRHGQFKLGGKMFDFRLKHKFPKKLSEEFLLIDLLNGLGCLAEGKEHVLSRVRDRVLEKPLARMRRIINAYAGERTRALWRRWISGEASQKGQEAVAHA